MKAIAKVSIGSFLPDDELKGLSDERIAELVDAGFAEYAEYAGLSDDELQAEAQAEAARLEAEKQRLADEEKLQAEAEQKRLADEAAAALPEQAPEPKKPVKKG